MDSNIGTFTFDPFGTFEFLKEVPVTKTFFDKRKRMGDLLGMRNFVNLEVLAYQDKIDDGDAAARAIQNSANYEINRAYAYLEMQDSITKYPEGFKWEKVNMVQFDSLMVAFQKEQTFFRKKDTPPSVPVINGNQS